MKISFKTVSEKDLQRLNEIVNDLKVARFLNLIPPVSMKSTREFYSQCKKNGMRWYAIVIDGVIAGSTHFAPRSKHGKQAHVAEFGISIAREFWGRGVGGRAINFITTEAGKSGIKRIEFEVVADNQRARELYLQHGFRKEGLKKKSFLINGRYHDTVVMARLLS